MSAHSILPPSGAPIWGRCAAAIQAIAQEPNKETLQSREGAAAHWLGAERISAWLNGTECPHGIGSKADNGVIIDEKMDEGASIYADDFIERAQQLSPRQVLVETRVNAAQTIHPENWGTLDGAIIAGAHRLIVVSDYKHGHKEVPAKDNLQLADYAAGIADGLGLDGHTSQQWQVEFRIVQPYSYSKAGVVDVWRGRLTDLRSDWNQLRGKAEEFFSGNAVARPGEHCRYCPGAAQGCKALQQFTYSVKDYCERPPEFNAMSGSDLAVERRLLLEAQEAVKGRLSALEDQLHHDIRNGDSSSGLALEVRPGRQVWDPAVPVSQALALCKQFGVDASKDAAITPKQSIDKAPAAVRGYMREAVKGLTKTNSKTVLTNADETIAAKTFKR